MSEKLMALFKALQSIVLDSQALLLLLPALALLYAIDGPKTLTLLEWMLFAAVIGGFAIQISLTIFPQVKLGELVERAADDPKGAAMVAAALIVFVGMLILSIVLWAKP